MELYEALTGTQPPILYWWFDYETDSELYEEISNYYGE